MIEKHRNERPRQNEEAKSSESTTMSEGSSDEWNTSSDATEISFADKVKSDSESRGSEIKSDGESRNSEIKSEDELPPLEEVKIEDLTFITSRNVEFEEKKEEIKSKFLIENTKKPEAEIQARSNKISIEEVLDIPAVSQKSVFKAEEETQEILDPEFHELESPSQETINKLLKKQQLDLDELD